MASSLDPIFPLPAGTGLDRNLKPGEGSKILANDTMLDCGLTYRAFWHVWEQTELNAAKIYPRYVGQNPHAAATWMEAVVWCRKIGHPMREIVPISEAKAAKIREKEAKAKPEKGKKVSDQSKLVCPECSNADVMKSRRAGVPGFKCRQCKHWWPATAPTLPVQAPDDAPAPKTAKKGKKKPKKADEKKSKKSKKKKSKN